MFHHLFRLTSSEPGYAYYGENYRLPALFYMQFSFITMVIAALASLAILVVLLPSMHRKLPTMIEGVTAIFIGSVAGYGLIIPEWQVGFLELPHEALSYQPAHHHAHFLHGDELISMQLGLRIGLSGSNFTLLHAAHSNLTFYWDERIEFDTLDGMSRQYRNSLLRGLPIAILELQEQVIGCVEQGFWWPFYLRTAGYYCSCLLAAAITLWALTCLLMIAVPEHGALSLAVTGVVLTSVPILYAVILKFPPLPGDQLRVAGRYMTLKFGPCLWINLAGGLWATLLGTSLYFYHKRRPHEFFTDFHIDFDFYHGERRRTIFLETAQKMGKSLEEMSDARYEDTRL